MCGGIGCCEGDSVRVVCKISNSGGATGLGDVRPVLSSIAVRRHEKDVVNNVSKSSDVAGLFTLESNHLLSDDVSGDVVVNGLS